MKICFYATTILEHGRGLEKYFIDTSTKLNGTNNLMIDIVTMDDNFSHKILDLLSIYTFKKIDHAVLYSENSESIKQKLGSVNYYKCKSFEEVRNKLNEYDLIYSKNELLEAFIFKFFIKYSTLPPIIFGCHTSLHYPVTLNFMQRFRNILYSSFIYKFLSSGVKAFHTLNSYDTQFTQKLFPHKPVIKIYNSLDFDAFLKKVDTTNYKFDIKKLKVLWIGAITEMKGINDLIQIITHLNERSDTYKQIQWIIVGSGSDKYKIDSLQRKYDNIFVLGQLAADRIPGLMKQCNLHISTSKAETFSYVTLEANCSGLPSFSYKTSGQSDIIDNGINGLLLDSTDQFILEINNFIEKKYIFTDTSSYIKQKFDSTSLLKQLSDMFLSFKQR